LGIHRVAKAGDDLAHGRSRKLFAVEPRMAHRLL
jgi:hypothetical protein